MTTPIFPNDSGPPRILIIDDNQSIHRDFQLVLVDEMPNAELEADEQRVYGGASKPSPSSPVFVLAHALSGLEGIELVKKSLADDRPFQMAFVDVRMPGIDGVETIARIWRLDPRIQMVICTAYADYSQDDLSGRLGHTDRLLVLKKPFDAIEVTQLAGTLTAKWFLARQAALKLEEMELLVARRTRKVLELQRQSLSRGADTPVPAPPPVEGEGADDDEASASKLPVVLLVGGEDAGRRQLTQALGSNYQFAEARGGEQGLATACELVPDLVLADFAAPGLDGAEFCRQLKANQITSHIPMVLLASRDSEAQQVQALGAGADDYLVQPVSGTLLKARVENLIESRRQLRPVPPAGAELHPRDLIADQADAQFLQRIVAIAEQHLSDFEFDVDDLARKAAVSRRQLFRKLKAISGATPKGLIRTVRLKRASQLLVESQMTVTEITYAVGFSDVKHFRNLFRDEFGVVPSDYAKRPIAP
jgi:CheY-like chemotaxis protein/AraC-like DNA-binding protein